jgi:small-conductance mechanosensitive channel
MTSRLRAILVAALALLTCAAPAVAEQTPAPAAATPSAAPAGADQAGPPTAAPPAPTRDQQSVTAQPVPPAALPPEVHRAIERLVGTMESAEKSLTRMQDLEDDIGRLRDEVEHVIAKTTEVADGLRPRLADLRSQIDKLGPAPGKDAPPEAPAVTAERARLINEATALDGAIKTLELTWVRARQTIDRITDLRLQIFTRSILERMSSPLLPGLWSDVARDLPQVGRLARYVLTDWWNTLQRNAPLSWVLFLGAGALYLGLKLLARRTTAARRVARPSPPTFFERAATASWVAPLNALPAILAALALYVSLDACGLLYYPSIGIAAALLRGVFVHAAVSALIVAVLAPDRPDQRLVSLSNASARRMSRNLQAMSFVYAADLALSSIARVLYLPLSLSVVQSLAASAAFAGLLVGLLLTPFEPQGASADRPVSRDAPRWLKLPLWFAVFFIIGAIALGYLALARFASHQLVMTGVVAAVATLLFLAIRAFTREPGDAAHPVTQVLQDRFGLDEPRRQQLAKLTEAALTLTLGVLALPVLLLQWGFSEAEIRDWVKQAFFGFEIGQFKISVARIIIGLVLFTALLFATRVLQRWLREAVLLPNRTDPGIANSIETTVGYAGTAIAALLAISYAGFDVTNLAIVAGALSVGIGFGLQSIVNNFVSGLILLIERPVKVGDWVVVGNQQGNVRKISVRSTEIETFDKASLIVPNSELVTGRVLNWTHRNAMGRITVKVTTGTNADPRKIRQALLDCAKRSGLALQTPAPDASFDGFSPEQLEFSVRIHLADISRGSQAQSELRLAIMERLRDMDVEKAATAVPEPAMV